MSKRTARQSGKNRRQQTPKGENKAWMYASLKHHNMNLRVPSGTQYKRKPPGTRWDKED